MSSFHITGHRNSLSISYKVQYLIEYFIHATYSMHWQLNPPKLLEKCNKSTLCIWCTLILLFWGVYWTINGKTQICHFNNKPAHWIKQHEENIMTEFSSWRELLTLSDFWGWYECTQRLCPVFLLQWQTHTPL